MAVAVVGQGKPRLVTQASTPCEVQMPARPGQDGLSAAGFGCVNLQWTLMQTLADVLLLQDALTSSGSSCRRLLGGTFIAEDRSMQWPLMQTPAKALLPQADYSLRQQYHAA